MAEKKEVKEVSEFEALVIEREKEGIKAANKIADYLDSYGYIRPDGDYQHEENGVRFIHNRVLNTISVEHGGSDMFRANLTTKTCPLFKNGSWQLALDRVLERFASIDKDTVKRKNEVAIRATMGLPKI